MKFYILLTIFGFLNASKNVLKDIKVQEGKELVKEHIVLDKENGVSTAHTGKHCGRKGVTELIDSVNGIVANKFDKDDGDSVELLCVIRKFDLKTDMTPNQVAQGLKKAHNKMPNVIEEVIQDYILEDYEKASSLPDRIRGFCAGLKIVSKKVVPSLEEANKLAVKEAIASKKNARKRALVRNFTACTNGSTQVIKDCSPAKLRAKCKIRVSSCTYWVRCPLDLGTGGFDCTGVHSFSSIICCDFDCSA